MSYFTYFFTSIIFLLSLPKIKNFIVLPFNTMFIKDKTIEETNYFSNLTQTELYVNITLGSKKDLIKSILKMDKNGFIIYEKSL